MRPRKLNTWQEWLESDRLIATAFLQKWNEKEATERFQAQAEGTQPRLDEAWGILNEDGKLLSTIVTRQGRLMFDGAPVDVGNVNMVGSLPEERGSGNIRSLMKEVLTDFRARGDLFAVLHPFSFRFYRKYGFELGSRSMRQVTSIDQFAGFRCGYKAKRVESQEDADIVRGLYESFILTRNLADMRSDRNWRYRGGGEYGEPNWWHGDAQNYTYYFDDENGTHRAYFQFRFKPGEKGPIIGDMEITEMVYDSPEAFRNVLGFIYGMRAKLIEVSVELMDTLDLSTILPECDKVRRTLDGHQMVRVLDVERLLERMAYPTGSGSFTVGVEDGFLPENTGVYAVSYEDGRAVGVERCGKTADLDVTVETLMQLAIGLITLDEAEFRDGTVVRGSREILTKVFPRKTVCL